ncbi:hypothetical protein F4781DRAFT_326750 [Annulohypoxylon bovei var. microspora]|nr:hypothetical protein F4781DRAFT_326750 [Annulohypoxylon bovei var. microspora]
MFFWLFVFYSPLPPFSISRIAYFGMQHFHARLLPKTTKWRVWFGVKTLRRFLVGGQKSGIDCDSSLHGCVFGFLIEVLEGHHSRPMRGRQRKKEKKNREEKIRRVLFFTCNCVIGHWLMENICVVLHICSKIFDVIYRSDTPATCQCRSCSIQGRHGICKMRLSWTRDQPPNGLIRRPGVAQQRRQHFRGNLWPDTWLPPASRKNCQALCQRAAGPADGVSAYPQLSVMPSQRGSAYRLS